MIRPEIFPSDVVGLFTTSSDPQDKELLPLYGMKAIYLPEQQHTDRVIVVDGSEERAIADAVITRHRGLLIGVKVADCLPVLIFDPETKTVASVHAGWRGTAKAILRKTITKLLQMGSRPDTLLLAFGPSIRGCCYRVGPEVVQALKQVTPGQDFIVNGPDGLRVDLLKANMAQALAEGVLEKNIWSSGDCTFCSNGMFFSYRRDKTSKRQGGYIGLR